MNKTAKDVAYIGVAAASLTAVKLALSWLANVELVTLLLVFYTLCLGKNRAFFACNVFIVVEVFIYGFGAWTISYILHWNFIVLITYLLYRKKVRKSIIYALAITGATLAFGFQTTLIEVFLYSFNTNFLQTFALRYFMGLSFFLTHILSAFITVFFLLPLLCKIPILDEENKIVLY